MVQVNSKTLEFLPEVETLIKVVCYLVQTILSRTKSYWLFRSKTEKRLEKCLIKLFGAFCFKQRPFLVNVMINFVHETRSWHLEYINFRLFKLLLESKIDPEIILTAFSSHIQLLLDRDSITGAIQVANVLIQLFTVRDVWGSINFPDLTPLLRMFHTSVVSDEHLDEINSYLALCLSKLFENISCADLLRVITVMTSLALDTSTAVFIEFGNLTLDAVVAYTKKLGSLSQIPSFLMEFLTEFITSPEPSKSILACKIVARLFDSEGNYNEFLTPRIFYCHMSYDIKPSLANDELLFILKHQKSLYKSLFFTFKHHIDHKINSNVIYTTICTIIAKKLPGTEAATVVCLIMDIQKFAIESKIPQRTKNYVHGLVLSLMSLHCWIYRAKPLLNYIDEVTSKRFAEGQHLLPSSSGVRVPESSHKSNQSHQKSLYFDNIELRYALWKCFVTKDIEVSSHTAPASPIPSKPKNTKQFQLKLNLT